MKKRSNFVRKRVIEAALICGFINNSDLSNKKLLQKKLNDFLPKKDENLHIILLHSEDLLVEGKKYSKKGRYEFAYIFYATYFEHFINEIINIWVINKKLSSEINNNLIRRLNLEDKFTWILTVLNLPKFSRDHYKIIKVISEKRNNFIHYKYTSIPFNTNEEVGKSEWKNNFKKIIKAIRYTKYYRSKVVFKGKKKDSK